jgi:phosphonate transport system substrate-binding protein
MIRNKFAGLGVAVALGSALLGTSHVAVAAEEVTFAVTDVKGLEQLRRDWGDFRSVLEDRSGLEIEFASVTSRTAAAELLKSERVDFVLTGPAEYVVMRKQTGAEPVVGFSRPDYFSGVYVMADSGITSVEDLEGRKVAVDEVGSTSGHLGPLQALADHGISPQDDLDVINVSPKVGFESLKRGDVAAWGANYMDDYLFLRNNDSSTELGEFKTVARGPDLPNDVLLAGDHVAQATINQLSGAITEHSEELVDAIVPEDDGENRKYEGMQFLTNVKDSDYDYVRQAYANIGYPQYNEFVGN